MTSRSIASLLAVSLSACGGNGGVGPSSVEESTPSPRFEGSYTLTFRLSDTCGDLAGTEYRWDLQGTQGEITALLTLPDGDPAIELRLDTGFLPYSDDPSRIEGFLSLADFSQASGFGQVRGPWSRSSRGPAEVAEGTAELSIHVADARRECSAIDHKWSLRVR